MAILQSILDVVELCSQHGLRHAVISPGSRSAALTIAFARHPDIQTFVIPDERSAGYFALGLSQVVCAPVAVVCTSGTAALNLGPAVAEAYFLQIPLLMLTADRPEEWIGQQDGQTLFQNGLFGRHVKFAAELPTDLIHSDAGWFLNRIVNQSFNYLINKGVVGPVHLNVPIREPFYPNIQEKYEYNSGVRKISFTPTVETLTADSWRILLSEMELSERILIAGGQQVYNQNLIQSLSTLQSEFGLPVVGDIISNFFSHKSFVSTQELFLNGHNSVDLESLRPTLLITFGNSFISKNLKLYLRHCRPTIHWHLSTGQELIDTFQSVTRVIPVCAEKFFKELVEELDMMLFREGEDAFVDEGFLNHWQQLDGAAKRWIETFLPNQEFNEFSALQRVMEALSEGIQLHLANSMAVRYANLIGLPGRKIEVFSNRGTSGIDGCLSTAIGAAAGFKGLVFVVIGDVAFFYDRNALWHPHVGANVRIILLNNDGGGIFRMIEGPAQLPEREVYFETPHHFTAERTAQDAGMEYYSCTNWEEFNNQLPAFLEPEGRGKLLEIKTDMTVNSTVFSAFKKWS